MISSYCFLPLLLQTNVNVDMKTCGRKQAKKKRKRKNTTQKQNRADKNYSIVN